MQSDHRANELLSIFEDVALPLADAYTATQNSFHWSPEQSALVIGDLRLPLHCLNRVYLVGAGKAGVPMSRAVVDTLRQDESLWARFAGGTVNVYRDQADECVPRVTFFPADHPDPNQSSVDGARAALSLLSASASGDLVIAVISGGGSSLLELPRQGICLDDFRAANRLLVTGGATIQEINTVRKHLSQVKGGRLRLAAPDAMFVTLVLSDVIGDDLSSIASGPTVPDTTTYADAIEVLQRHGIWDSMPESCRTRLVSESPDEDKGTTLWQAHLCPLTHSVVVASNAVILAALEARLASPPYDRFVPRVRREEVPVTGSVDEAVAQHYGQALKASSAGETLLLFGGEPVVSVPPNARGRGGRMLHYALRVAQRISCREWVVLAAGTDGLDGSSPCAGAIVSGETIALARHHGLDADTFLNAFDSYGFFRLLEERSGKCMLITTGPTGTNVNDLMLWWL